MIGHVLEDLGTVTVIVARFVWASTPDRFAQASNDRIHAGNPAGRSAAGITECSAVVIVEPYNTNGRATSGVITGNNACSAVFHDAHNLAKACALVIVPLRLAESGYVGCNTVA